MAYDDPNAVLRQEVRMASVAGANGTNAAARFRVFQKSRLVAAHCWVETAGTSAGAGNAIILKQGTTALATFTLGTLTANSQVDITGLAATLNPGDAITITNGTDATGVASVVLELQQTPDAARSAY
jgi:hypothetical protein